MMRIITTIKIVVLNAFLFIAILLSLLAAVLLYGIRLDSITLPQADIKDIYISYDNGLLLGADTITITPSSEEPEEFTGDQIISIADKVLFALHFVKQIEVKKILYNEQSINALYDDGILSLSNKDGELNASVAIVDEKIAADIKNAEYRPLNIKATAKLFFDPYAKKIDSSIELASKLITSNASIEITKESAKAKIHKSFFEYEKFSGALWAEADIDIENKKATLTGRIETMDIFSDFCVASDLKRAEVSLYNTNIASIKNLIETVNIPDSVRDWVYGKIIAGKYGLEYLYLPIDIENRKPLLKELRVKASLDKTTVKFNKGLKRAKASDIYLEIIDEKLLFEAPEVHYESTPLEINGSIDMLFTKPLLLLNISSDTKLDSTLHEILKAYGISMDFLTQKQGKNRSLFSMSLGLGDSALSTFVDTHFTDSEFNIAGETLHSKDGKIKVKNKNVEIQNLNILYKEMADINITGDLDTEKKTLSSRLHINSLDIGGKEIVDMKDVSADVSISYKDDISIISKELHTDILYKSNILDLKVHDLSSFINASAVLKMFNIQNGNLHFIKKGDDIDAQASVESNGTALFKNGESIKRFDARYTKSAKENKIIINDNIKVNIYPKKINVEYDAIDLSISSLMKRYDQNSQRRELVTKKYREKSEKEGLAIQLYARNSNILYEERILPSNMYSLFFKDDLLDFELENGKTRIVAHKDSDELTITAKNINSKFTKKLFKFEMKEGKADLLTSGNIKTKEFYGVLSIKEATVKGFALINNVIAFINTIPSLVTLQNPGFDSQGYLIKNGTIEYFLSGDTLYLNTIRLIGNNTDIIGYGQMDIKNKDLDLTLSLNTIKGLSNLLGKIPLLGYALLGDEKTIGTLISVKGPLDNPEVKTTLAENAALYPFSVIKRTILWPFKLFEDDKE